MKNNFKKITSVIIAAMIAFGAVAGCIAPFILADAAETGEVLSFKTEIHSYSEELGEWVLTDTVKPGENVKARLFIDTNYFTYSGAVIVFYDNNFFTDSYMDNSIYNLMFNENQNSLAYINDVNGIFTKGNDKNAVIMGLLDNGYITQEFFETHTAFIFTFTIKTLTPQMISGEHWFVEFDLQVLDSAEGTGSFFIVPETIMNTMNTTDDHYAYINVPVCEENGKLEDSVGMFAYDVEAKVENYPVHIIENSPETVTVTFDANAGMFSDGSETRTVMGVVGSELQLYDTPEKDGFIFDCWYPPLPSLFPDEDMTFTAVWQYEDYTVDYVLIGDVPDWANVPATIQATPGEQIAVAEMPEYEGYEFDGWYYNGIRINESFEMPEQDVVLEGMWRLREYNIVFDAGGGEFADGSSMYIDTLTLGSEVFLPSDPTREGFEFMGWHDENGNQTYPPDTMPAKNVYLRAYWEAEYCDVIFNFPDGTQNKVIYQYGEQIDMPDVPAPEGFEFKGWADENGNLITEPVIIGTENISFYAVLAVKSNRVTYISNGFTYAVYNVDFGSEIPVPDGPVADGYVFEGWSPEIPSTMPDEDLVFIAEFRRFCKADKFDVTATFDKDCFGENAELSVEEINKTNEPGGFYFNGQKYEQIGLYNIKIVNDSGEAIQPLSGKKVTVKIALPDEYKNKKDFIVNHWLINGKREQFRTANGTVKIENGYLVFETGSFSEFEVFVKPSITVSKGPDKTDYTYKGGTVDLSGIVIVGENGETVTDISKITIVNDIDTSKIGEQTVTVDYEGSKAEFTVNVSYAWWQWIIRILLLGFIWY